LTAGPAAPAGLTLGWARGTAVGVVETTGLGPAIAVARDAVVGLVAADGAQAVSVKAVHARTRAIHLVMVVARERASQRWPGEEAVRARGLPR
jgi:hypothetical protein